MMKRERMIAAIGHRQPDIIPYHCGLTMRMSERMDAYAGDKGAYARMESHATDAGFPFREEELPGKPGYFRDHFGVVWNRSGADKDIGVIESPVIPDIANRDYAFPDIGETELRARLRAMIEGRGDRFASGSIGFSLFERAWTLATMPEILAGMVLHPSHVESLLDEICEYNLRVIDILIGYDVDAIYFGDDWGQQKGLIMGPAHWRRFIKPRLKRMYARAKGAGKFVIQHSCGDIGEIFPDLIDIGLDVYNTFQPEIYDIRAVKREFGRDLSFWGGISTQRILPSGTPEQVHDVVIETMRVMGEGGGYVAAPTHAVPYDVPPENLLAMIDVFINQGRYL